MKFILEIIALVLLLIVQVFFNSAILGILLSVIATVLSIIALQSAKKNNYSKVFAIIVLVLSCLNLFFYLAAAIYFTVLSPERLMPN